MHVFSKSIPSSCGHDMHRKQQVSIHAAKLSSCCECCCVTCGLLLVLVSCPPLQCDCKKERKKVYYVVKYKKSKCH